MDGLKFPTSKEFGHICLILTAQQRALLAVHGELHILAQHLHRLCLRIYFHERDTQKELTRRKFFRIRIGGHIISEAVHLGLHILALRAHLRGVQRFLRLKHNRTHILLRLSRHANCARHRIEQESRSGKVVFTSLFRLYRESAIRIRLGRTHHRAARILKHQQRPGECDPSVVCHHAFQDYPGVGRKREGEKKQNKTNRPTHQSCRFCFHSHTPYTKKYMLLQV